MPTMDRRELLRGSASMLALRRAPWALGGAATVIAPALAQSVLRPEVSLGIQEDGYAEEAIQACRDQAKPSDYP